MNTNPQSKRILCFGDSNTRGFVPGSGGKERYPADVRWTGILQEDLGKNFEVIEEGLDARLINKEDPRPGFVGKNGLAYLIPCLDTHKPLDYITLMLGTPDLKECMNLSAEEIATSLSATIDAIHTSAKAWPAMPKVIVISPAIIDDTTPFASAMFKGGTDKNKKLSTLYKKVAEEKSAIFIDGASFLKVDPKEGIHLTPESHALLAQALVEVIG